VSCQFILFFFLKIWTGLCRTTIKTGKLDHGNPAEDLPWTFKEHDCVEGRYDNPRCGDANFYYFTGSWDTSGKYCTCGKDLCNLGDAKGGNTVILNSYTILWIFFICFFTIDKECVLCKDWVSDEIDGGKSRSGNYAKYTTATCKEWRDEGNPKGGRYSMNCFQGESVKVEITVHENHIISTLHYITSMKSTMIYAT
jgi:hypothetical protein